MRKVLVFSIFFGSIGAFFASCSKDSQGDVLASDAATVVNASVAAGGTYELVLDKWQNATISKQASHYTLSATQMDMKSGAYVYRYTPAAKFTGNDEVTLSSKVSYASANTGTGGCGNGQHTGNHSGGGSVMYTNTFMTIKIKVTQ